MKKKNLFIQSALYMPYGRILIAEKIRCLPAVWGLMAVFLCMIPFSFSLASEGGDSVVAKVNAQNIYRSQLDPEVDKLLSKYKKHGLQKTSPELLRRLQKEPLERLITQELLFQASRDMVVQGIEDRIDEQMQMLRKRAVSGEQLVESIKNMKMTAKETRDSIRKNLLIEAYLERQGILNPEIREEDIRQYYEKNRNSFMRPYSARVSHILIKAPNDGDPEAIRRAREKIEEIHHLIADGEKFPEMAQQYSECDSASKGGDLGHISRGYMPSEFDKVAFSLQEGELSDIVRTRFGFHIITVLGKKTEELIPLDEVKEFIRRYLARELTRKRIGEHISDLRAKAKIEEFPQLIQ
ncbi:MAG: peptidylprolyl isomerase [Nitrospirota bacterium]